MALRSPARWDREEMSQPLLRIEDLHATLYAAMGIPANTAYVVEKRPVYVTRDGRGKPIQALFA